MHEIKEIFARLDTWVNRIQVHWPKVLRVSEDLSVFRRLWIRTYKLFIVVVVLGLIMWGIYWVFIYGMNIANPDPALKLAVPTLLPSPTALAETNPWKDQAWITPDEARSLREQSNVINLAYLDGGGASYSRNFSIIFDQNTWKQIKPLGIDALTVNGTSITFTVSGQTYTLNMYQPFVLANMYNQVLLADSNGKIWAIDSSEAKTVSLQEAVKSLPIIVSPNPNLSFTY